MRISLQRSTRAIARVLAGNHVPAVPNDFLIHMVSTPPLRPDTPQVLTVSELTSSTNYTGKRLGLSLFKVVGTQSFLQPFKITKLIIKHRLVAPPMADANIDGRVEGISNPVYNNNFVFADTKPAHYDITVREHWGQNYLLFPRVATSISNGEITIKPLINTVEPLFAYASQSKSEELIPSHLNNMIVNYVDISTSPVGKHNLPSIAGREGSDNIPLIFDEQFQIQLELGDVDPNATYYLAETREFNNLILWNEQGYHFSPEPLTLYVQKLQSGPRQLKSISKPLVLTPIESGITFNTEVRTSYEVIVDAELDPLFTIENSRYEFVANLPPLPDI